MKPPSTTRPETERERQKTISTLEDNSDEISEQQITILHLLVHPTNLPVKNWTKLDPENKFYMRQSIRVYEGNHSHDLDRLMPI